MIKENDIAQATSKGHVVDGQTLQPISNVEIQVIGHSHLVYTTVDGACQLSGIASGS